MTERLDVPRNGERVRFRDRGNVKRDGAITVAEGIVNGRPLEHGGRAYVPVWAEREGREPTTIFVAETNLLGTIPHEAA